MYEISHLAETELQTRTAYRNKIIQDQRLEWMMPMFTSECSAGAATKNNWSYLIYLRHMAKSLTKIHCCELVLITL